METSDILVSLFWLATSIWLGCFVVVAVDSAYRGISSWFWRFAALVGGPFVLLAYGLVRQKDSQK